MGKLQAREAARGRKPLAGVPAEVLKIGALKLLEGKGTWEKDPPPSATALTLPFDLFDAFDAGFDAGFGAGDFAPFCSVFIAFTFTDFAMKRFTVKRLTLLLPLALVACAPRPGGAYTPANIDPLSLPPAPGAGITRKLNDLTALKPLSVSGDGSLKVNRGNGAGNGKALKVGGKTFAKGFGTRAGSAIRFDLGGKCQTFTALVGVDDEAGKGGSVIFRALADDRAVFTSAARRGGDPALRVSADVRGAQTLTLAVQGGEDGGAQDHADWLSPEVTCTAYAGPITITRGGTYRGAWESLDPRVPAVRIQTGEPVVIERSLLRGRGDLIRGSNVSLTVRDSRAFGLNPDVPGKSQGRFIDVSASSLRVEHNDIQGTRGIYLNGYTGNRGKDQTVKVFFNFARDIDGRISDGKGGYRLTKPDWAQFVQLGKVQSVPGIEIAWNRVENAPRESGVEDNINLYDSSGTQASPINIHDNLIRGGYAPDPAASYTGGGILVGDGCTRQNFVEVTDNTVIETSNHGIAVASGNFARITGNTILGTGRLADGTLLDADDDAGIYLRDYCKTPGYRPETVVASGNTIGWGTPTAGNAGKRYDVSAAAGTSAQNTLVAGGAIDPALLAAAVAAWEARAQAEGVALGARDTTE